MVSGSVCWTANQRRTISDHRIRTCTHLRMGQLNSSNVRIYVAQIKQYGGACITNSIPRVHITFSLSPQLKTYKILLIFFRGKNFY